MTTQQTTEEYLSQRISWIRGQKVMFDFVLAELYDVETKVLNQAVRRNIERFPKDFMFQLSYQEVRNSRSQIVTLKDEKFVGTHGKNVKYLPYAFTEQGIAMLSSVLRSPRAIQVNIEIMRTFVHLRHLISSNEELAQKLSALEDKYDAQFKTVFDAIRALMKPPEVPGRSIGFATWRED